MTTEPFDVAILGGGNAGIAVTGPVRRAGMSVAMIDARDLGGTCPNRGCTPKKILVAAGHALHEIEPARVHEIALGKAKLDWAALIDRKTAMIKDIPGNMARAMEKRQVEVIRGSAAFVAAHETHFSWRFKRSAKRNIYWKNIFNLAPRTTSGAFSTSWWRFLNGPNW